MKPVAAFECSALRCVARSLSRALPALLLGAPLALAQGDPPAWMVPAGPVPDAEVKLLGQGTTPAQLAAIEQQDAADLAARPRRERAAAPAYAPKEDVPGTYVELIRDPSRVVVDATARPGTATAVGRNWKAIFDAEGLTLHPRVGRQHPSQPTSFALARVTLGGAALDVTPAQVGVSGATVTLDRGGLWEVYHLAVDALEQTFVFDELPGVGDLVVQLDVTSAWSVFPGDDFIRFVDADLGEIRYGRAYAVDATGERAEIARTWTGEGISLTVPAAFVAHATLPLVIDPIMGTTMSQMVDPDDDLHPDVAFANGTYWLTFQDFYSATDADVFVCTVSPGGVVGPVYSIDTTVDYWEAPAIAATPIVDRLLVVASTTPNGPGSANANIEGRFVDTSTALALGAQFVIDETGFSCVAPDVGGTWTTNGSYADFCVVWEREWAAADHDILARVVHSDGTFLTGTLDISNLGTNDDYAPAVSKSRGDEVLVGDYWNIAWIRDGDQDGIGTPFTHRVYFTGGLSAVGELTVFPTAYASSVDVTSTFDDPIPGTSDRPYLVTFDRDLPNLDIYMTVCTHSAVYTTDVISALEDYDADLLSRDPSIATDGVSFTMAYDELWWGVVPPSTDYDTYALSGNIARSSAQGTAALSERHQRLQYTNGTQRHCVTTSRWDGGGLTDDALMAWEDYSTSVNGGSRIKLQLYDSATSDGSPIQAIGRQYCDANGHADSGDEGRLSSFIYGLGNASIGYWNWLYCVDMKLNAFGYFIVSTSVGNVNMPGNSVGRLCLGGTIGRAVGGTVMNSGAAGMIYTSFSPLMLPTPTGTFAAAPGQTLYFQCWHRDVAGGIATSNFSNACAIRFVP